MEVRKDEEANAIGGSPGDARCGRGSSHSADQPGDRAGRRERRARSVLHRYQQWGYSNQCVGIQGVGNTGNPQNITDILQYGSTADDFEFEEVGSTITVSPTNETTCDQQVNQ